MPAPRNPYDRRHLRNLALYRQKVSLIFNIAASEAAMIGTSIDSFDPSRPFSFADYPRAAYMMNELVRDFARDLDVQIIDGVEHEWNLANGKDDALVRSVFGDNLTPDMERRYFTTNEPAMDAFIKRKEGGMDLSERVWKYSDEFKSEIEMGIDIGLRDGLDARAMARDLQQYLRHPDMLFRRVRDEHGNLHLSQRAAAFHPGQGVYRSSYMNALRLTVTECNMAYRTADYLRWQQMDFVVGIEIELSNNHTCLDRNGVPQPFTDICDELKGKYPKEFKFVGWHPFCRCHATPILKTDEELDKELEAALLDEPEPDTTHSDNEVTDVPDGFKQWLDTNAERIERAQHRGKLPYFLRDNEIVGSAATGYKWEPSVTQPTAQQIAEQKRIFHDGVVQRYGERVLQVMSGISDVDTTALMQALKSADIAAIELEAKKLRDIGKQITSLEKLDNPLQVARQTSMAEANEINANVMRTLSKMPTELAARKSKLEFEIDWMENEGKRRYPKTWQYSQAAYKKELAIVERKIEVNKIGESVKDALAFAGTSRSKVIKELADEMRKLLASSHTSIDEMRSVAAQLNKKYDRLKPKPKVASAASPQAIPHETLKELKRRLGKDLPPTLKRLGDLIEKRISSGTYSSWTAQEIEQAERTIKQVLDNGCYGMNIPRVTRTGDDTVIEKIFSSWFKNQIETGTGKGMVDIEERKKASKRLFGTPRGIAAIDYEKYGFLMDKDILAQARSGIAGQYWDYGDGIQVRFKKDKVIATFTMQDSLGSGLYPSLCSDPKVTSFDVFGGRGGKEIVTSTADLSSAIDATRKYAMSYIELQYHGQLTLDCVESVFIPRDVVGKLHAGVLDLIKKSGAAIYSESVSGQLVML